MFSHLSSLPQPPPSTSSSWLYRHLPTVCWPYIKLMRWDKPAGAWLLYWPCVWSVSLASYPTLPDVKLLSVFGVGAWLMRGAGCTINDMWDRNIDLQIDRTRQRPIASSQLTLRQAWWTLAGQLTASLGLLLTLNPYSIGLGCLSLVPVAIYPLMKRWIPWPQAFLGLTFNWGAFLGYSAVVGHIVWATTLPLYLAGVCWTLVYDTIYAHQDTIGDRRLNLKSTALWFGENYSKRWMTAFGGMSMVFLAMAGFNVSMPWMYYVGWLGGVSHLAWQLYTVKLNQPKDCARVFASNAWFGAIITAGIWASSCY
jgi:4-hydroxybenzoate polyprenyltransferase